MVVSLCMSALWWTGDLSRVTQPLPQDADIDSSPFNPISTSGLIRNQKLLRISSLAIDGFDWVSGPASWTSLIFSSILAYKKDSGHHSYYSFCNSFNYETVTSLLYFTFFFSDSSFTVCSLCCLSLVCYSNQPCNHVLVVMVRCGWGLQSVWMFSL